MKLFNRISAFLFFLVLILMISCDDNDSVEFFPVAKFSIIKVDNELVEFRNNSINSTAYLWDFGDGTTSTEKNPVHIYSDIGNYEVVLTAKLDIKSDQISHVAIVSKIYPEELTELMNPPFGSKAEGISFSWNGKGYVGSGSANFQYSQDLWEFDPSNQTWTELAGTPKEFARGVSFVINGAAYMGLGQIPWGSGANEFYKYDIAADSYTSIGSFPIDNNNNNSNWTDAEAFTFQEKGYVLGSPGNFQDVVKVVEFNPDNNSWLEKSVYPGASSSGLVSFMLDGIAYVGMGNKFQFSAFETSQDMWAYDIANNSWSQLSDFPALGRRDAIGFVYNDKGYLAFGFQNNPNTGASSAFPEIWEYDVASDTWTQIESIPIAFSSQGYQFILGDKLYFGGGYNVGNNSLGDFYEYAF